MLLSEDWLLDRDEPSRCRFKLCVLAPGGGGPGGGPGNGIPGRHVLSGDALPDGAGEGDAVVGD